MFGVNGQVSINGREGFRIDDFESGEVGLHMLENPFAIVFGTHEQAQACAAALCSIQEGELDISRAGIKP